MTQRMCFVQRDHSGYRNRTARANLLGRSPELIIGLGDSREAAELLMVAWSKRPPHRLLQVATP